MKRGAIAAAAALIGGGAGSADAQVLVERWACQHSRSEILDDSGRLLLVEHRTFDLRAMSDETAWADGSRLLPEGEKGLQMRGAWAREGDSFTFDGENMDGWDWVAFAFSVEDVPHDPNRMMHSSETPQDDGSVHKLDVICDVRFRKRVGG